MLTTLTFGQEQRLHSARRGFTLIELLVVIAIIAILAAILFPVFARARENARRASCMSNEKQIGLGLMMYTQDYDEKTPLESFGVNGDGQSDASNGSYKWMDAIYPYVRSEQIFDCPSDSKNKLYQNYLDTGLGANTNYGSYCMNTAYYGDLTGDDSGAWHNPMGQSLAAIVNAAGTVWIEESYSGLTSSTTEGVGNPWQNIATQPTAANGGLIISNVDGFPGLKFAEARHLGTMNVLYCDGHVKSQQLTNLLQTGAAGEYTAFTIEAD